MNEEQLIELLKKNLHIFIEDDSSIIKRELVVGLYYGDELITSSKVECPCSDCGEY